MPELTTIPAAELAELRERLARLAREKAQLQLIALLMNRLSELPGLEKTVEGMLQFVMEILGGLNATIFYRLDDAIYHVDVHGLREVVTQIEDDLVRKVFETSELASRERDFSQTGMMTKEFANATTWAMPLLVGGELVGVLRVDDLTVAGRELQDEVQTFLRYASLVLKNEILGETRLRRAFDQISVANRELTHEIAERRGAEQDLQRAKDELERRVEERTTELRAINQRLQLELRERARAEAALAARHSTLRGIIEGTDSPIFSLDREGRYVAFNRSHASVMKRLYGVEIELGRRMLDSMAVGDREKAEGHFARALAGEHLVVSVYTGEEERARAWLEVAHHPVRAEDGQVIGVAVFASDVTERRRADAERQTNLWISESLDQVNRAIQGTDDLEQMMSDVLDAALAIFECDRAFLLYPCDPQVASYRVPMERTRPGFPGALARGLEVPVDPESARVLEAARAAAGPLTFGPESEPPLPTILKELFHVQSQITMAVYPTLREPYMFGLHQCSHARIWRPEEARLFQEIGRRLSDALTSLLTQRELRESENRYRRITEGLTDYLYTVRVENGRAVETTQSPACVAVTGYTAEEFGADSHLWFRMVAPEDRQLVQERVRQVLSGTDVSPLEHRILRKDGAVRWVRDTFLLLRDASGKLVSYDGVIEDITERKQAEEALRESEERYRTIFLNSPLGIFRSTFEGRFLAANPALARILGYDSPEAVIREIQDIGEQIYLRPDDRRRLVSEQLELTDVTRHLTRYRRRDGSELVVNQYLRTVRDAEGHPIFLEGILEDITDRQRAEDALRESEQRYRDIFDNVLDSLFLLEVTADGRFRTIEVNPALELATGIPRDRVIGKTQEEYLPEAAARNAIARYRRCVAAGRPIEEEIQLDLPVGRRQFHSTLIPARHDSGRIDRIIGISRDITERKQAEAELARLNRALRMLSDANQALIRVTDQAALLREVCRIVVDGGGYRMAWIGGALQDEAKGQHPVADGGVGAEAVGPAGVNWGPDEGTRGPTGQAILTGQACIARNIPGDPGFAFWPAAEVQRGCESIIALPLISQGETLGALRIDAAEPDAFEPQEVVILEELASDLAFGMTALRTRAKRDRAEAALQKSEEKYRTLIQKIQAAVVVHAADTRIVTCNSMAQELLGLTEDQLLGKAVIDPAWHFFRGDRTVMPPAEYPVSQVLATRQALRNFTVGVHRAPRADDVWVLVNADPVLGEGGAISQVIVTFIDITERKRAEEALQRREAELNESQRVAHIGSWDWDAVKDSIWWSLEYYRIYGLDPQQPIPAYREHLKAYAGESAQQLDALVQRAVATGEPYDVDLELADPRTSTRWVGARGEAKRDAEGRVWGLRGTTQDITERKRLELEMRRSVAAIEQAAETIIITDPDAVIQYVNPAFTGVTGYTREEAVGQRPSLWKSGRHDQEFYRSMWATLRSGETWRGHLVNKRKDGTEFEEDATISPVRDERGRVAHYVAVKRDVTQEVALEGQLRQAQKMEAIGRLAGGIAHDFNNLLQALLSNAQLLRMAPERVDTDLAELEAQIRRGAALTRQLLLFSRHQEARREPLDLNEAIAALGRLLRRLVRENITLAIELSTGSLIVDADRGQLDQVLMNLTINATDAMPGGGRLSIRTGREGGMAYFAVEDTGCGIPEGIRSRIFEPLFTTKPVGLGTGLGLSVVHDIVSQHRGRIDLDSTEGVGTTFRVLLPQPVSAETSRTAPAVKEDECPDGHGERILVVEDGAAARQGLRAILRALHYEVTAVGSGGEACALPGAPAYDALVSDVMLPDVEGTALVRELLGRWPRMGVILMSGYSEGDVLARAADLGRFHFLQKPFDMKALAKALRQTLAGH